MVNQRPLRWALIGPSTIAARRFLPALRAEGQEVVSVYSASAERAEGFASMHMLPLGTDDIELALKGADAAYVSSRNNQRLAQVMSVITAGCHVFCEKPVALQMEDGVPMVTAARSAGLVFAVNFHLRNAGTIMAMRSEVREGTLGVVHSARAQHALQLPPELRGWRLEQGAAGGGAILDLCSHTVDSFRFVLGREIVEVAAYSRGYDAAANRAEDSTVTVYALEGDIIASTYVSFVAPFAGTAFEVHGSEASLFGRSLLSANEPYGEVDRRDRDGHRLLARSSPEDLYRRGVRHFVEAVHGEGAPVADGIDGLRSLAVTLAIKDSALSGQSVKVQYPDIRWQQRSQTPAPDKVVAR